MNWRLERGLINNPEVGDIIQKSGGCRKVRWQASNNKGKSSGIRVIYYYIDKDDQIAMLLAYPKSQIDNLSDKQVAMLKTLIKEQFHA